MYQKVDSLALLNTFNQIWMECWIEKGYALENESGSSDKYLIRDIKEQKVGTIEFKPYTLDQNNNINTVFPFHKIELIANNPTSVVEIDKVAILKQFRGKNLDRLLTMIVHYSETHNISYYVVLLERVFYKTLKIVYKIPVKAVGEKIYYKGDYVVPAIVYPTEVCQNKKNYSWLITCQQEDKSKRVFT